MNSHTSASFYLASSLSAGIALARLLKPDGLVCLLLLATFTAMLWFFKGSRLRVAFWVVAGLVSLALGLCSMASTLPENRPLHYVHSQHESTGPTQVRIVEKLRHSAYSYRYLGEVVGLGGSPAEGKVLLEIRRDSAAFPFEIGQEFLCAIHPSPISGPGNPGQFDYRAYLQGLGVHGRLNLKSSSILRVETQRGGFIQSVKKIRTRLLIALDGLGLDPRESGIAKALLLGDRTRVDPELHSSYRKAGALHLLAVSGLHVGILAAFLHVLLSPLLHFGHGRLLRLLLGIFLLWGYAFLCGFSPSVVRAVILFSIISYALYMQRPGETLHFLALAWIFMLALINPNWLLQVGFQLSFAAVAAIVVFTPMLLRRWPWKGRLGSYAGRLVCVSLAAQAGTLPLTLFYFHQFPGVFLLTNLVLLPGIGILLVMGFACLFLQALSILPPLLASGYNLLLSQMNGFIQWTGTLTYFHLEGIPWNTSQLLLSALAIGFFGAFIRMGGRWLLRASALLFLGLQVWGILLRLDHLDTKTWVVPNKVKAGGFWVRQGSKLQVFSQDSAPMASLVRDAKTVWYLDSVEHQPISGNYRLGRRTLLVLDSSGLYSPSESSPDYLLLTSSPRLHFGRLLQDLNPGLVIADGSNYKSHVERWKRSCEKQGISFHSTSEEGAFIEHILQEIP